MPFIGYHTDSALPFKQNDVVVIPAGTRVKSMHPSRKEFMTKRKMTVTVHHVINGMSLTPFMNLREKDRHYYPEAALQFAEFDSMMLDYKTDPNPDSARETLEKIRNFRVHISNPTIAWPGAGGYWNEVDVNNIAT